MDYLRLNNLGTDMHNYTESRRFINLYRLSALIETDSLYYTSTFGIDIEVID